MSTVYYINSSVIEKIRPLDSLLSYLPSLFETRALRYRSSQDAYNFVLGRLMLRKALEVVGLPVNTLTKIYYNEEEKPLLDGLAFSISHSQHLVACAFAPKGNLGLDIEFPRSMDRKHFRHCFNEEEWAKIQADTSMHTFYSYWTQKEAILKANGLGLGHLLDIQIQTNTLAYMKNNSTPWHLQSFSFEKEAAYACLCSDEATEIILKHISLEELLF